MENYVCIYKNYRNARENFGDTTSIRFIASHQCCRAVLREEIGKQYNNVADFVYDLNKDIIPLHTVAIIHATDLCEIIDSSRFPKFEKELEPWQIFDNCSVRVTRGGDINNVFDRVAFIEKSARVRVENFNNVFELTDTFEDSKNWHSIGKYECLNENGDSHLQAREDTNEYLKSLGYKL